MKIPLKKKEVIRIVGIVIFIISGWHIVAQNTPQTFTYSSGQSVSTEDVNISYNGNWYGGKLVPALNGNVLEGFPYGLILSANAFEENLFVSKGYFPDYIRLTWELARFQSSVTFFRVFRRALGDNEYEQVAVLNNSETSWEDEFTESNVLYEYKLLADGIFPNREQPFLNTISGIGFRVPEGTVSGRITFDGGGAVQGVSVLAETDDDFNGSSLYLDGNDELVINHTLDDPNFAFENTFTFQAWVKPTSTTFSTIFDKDGQYTITKNTGSVSFSAGVQSVTVNFAEKVDTFYHVTAVRTASSLALYIQYDESTIYQSEIPFSGTTTKNNEPVYLGASNDGTQRFSGYLDEVRIWDRALDIDEVTENAFVLISGTEDKLSGYYRMNEGVGTNFYDLSREGFSFNANDGSIVGADWSTVVPNRNQLAVRGVTDENGNYLISGIPYSATGSSYRIVPVLSGRVYDPTERLLFIGPSSNAFSDVNFIDESSFIVTGEVFYKGTRFPVGEVQITIDGQTAVTSNGTPITTDVTGQFTLDVPIGKHQLQLVRNGHVFRGGGYFPDSISSYDFQAPLTIQERFIDTTLVKVVGKVVGGPVEAAKSQGLGRTKNNIGHSKVTMTTQKGYDLKEYVGNDSTATWGHEFYENKNGLVQKGSTNFKIANANPGDIEISPDTETGEYVAYLLPERYVISKIVAGRPNDPIPNYTYPESFHTILDLTSASLETVETDSTIDIANSSDENIFYLIDSVKFNIEQDFVLRERPKVTLRSKEGDIDRFWEKEIELKNGQGILQVSGDGYDDVLTNKPIFIQRNVYDTRVSVFESYENIDDGTIDNVPVVDGSVKIQNDLAINSRLQEFQINGQGYVDYTFIAGLPNIAGSFEKSMSVQVFTGTGGAIVTDWPTDGNGFTGYVFGGMPTGNNFVTAGPNMVDMIIRDPHGSNSYSFYEKGSTTGKEISYEVENGETVDINATLLLGAKVKTFAGLGAGVIIEAEFKNETSIGLEQSTNFIDNNTVLNYTTNTERWSTSAEPDFVGSPGDVFFGHSTNIVYGQSFFLELIPVTAAPCDGCIASGISGYDLGTSQSIRISPEFNTGFQYSQNHIENNLIPQLENLRDVFLTNAISRGEYVLKGGASFGESNTTDQIVRRADNSGLDGNVYSINYPINPFPSDSIYEDSVRWYNTQIKNWKNILATNEKEKLNAELIKNLSYDAGVIYESTEVVGKDSSKKDVFEFTINPSVSTQSGVEISGSGFNYSLSATYNHKEVKSEVNNENVETTFGYVLNDGDEGDFYSIDVKDPHSNTGTVFAVRGGQSSCPYVDSEVTKYYSTGEILSEATQSREGPQISVTQSIVSNVPQGRGANFALQLSDVSETGDDNFYRLSVDLLNSNGANLQFNGTNLGNGRTIFVPGRGTVDGILTLNQVVTDSLSFEDIPIVFHSLCQADPGDNLEDISDTAFVSAYFQPACSNVDLTAPLDQWLVNTGSQVLDGTIIQSVPLNINIENYDLNHSTFESLLFQYKASSSSQWITDKSYFLTQDAFDNSQSSNKELVSNRPTLSYIFETRDIQDRDYDLRVISTCADGTENTSDIISGTRDVKRPRLFGTPQPGDGILSSGDDIKITFDEEVEDGLLTSFNFSVRGVLNGTEIRHNKVLFFDGVDDHATVVQGVDLEDKSFTIEFWEQRLSSAKQVVYSQGDLEMGFDNGDHFYVKLGTGIYTTSTSYPANSTFRHWGVTYNSSDKLLNIYSDYQVPLDNKNVTTTFSPKGRFYVGQSPTGTNFYHGHLHDLRIWEVEKTQGQLFSNMLTTLTGDEVNLSGYWKMDEARGDIAVDYARKHAGILKGASWAVLPRGYAREFNGTSDYMTLPSGTVVITDEMDMTIEFWVKADAQNNTVIFSNGKGDGTDAAPSFENIWVIGSNNDGKLYAQNNDMTLVADVDVFDNEWHHVALVTRRIANTALYIDANQEDFNQSTNFGGFDGAKMALGARQFGATSFTYDQYFKGRIDEFRFWNLARTKDLIEIDINSELQGDEVGLLAYYPFNDTDVNLVLQPDFSDHVFESTSIATLQGTTTDNLDVPKIAGARPVQNVRFDWVVNDDEIIININEDPALVEQTVLEITVQDIEDLNENRLASPVTWTAYIRQNTVLWNEDELSFDKDFFDPISFEVDIINKGGTEQNYEISNLPSWLTLDEPSGTLLPDSKLTLNFEIDQAVNVGNYEHSIYLSSDFGFSEKLEIDLTVNGETPDWEVNSSDFEYTMSVVGYISYDGQISTNSNDLIAAVVGGEIRGVTNLQYIPAFDLYEFFLDVYSDLTNGETVEFQVYNASTGQTHVDVTPDLGFVRDQVIGLPSSPQEILVSNKQIVEYVLEEGWNWMSFNLDSPDLVGPDNLFSELTLDEGDLIKSLGQGRFAQYSNDLGWIVGPELSDGFNLKECYRMKVSSADTFSLIGNKLETSAISIPLNAGQTWIGYPALLTAEINNALSNVNFETGDFIRAQNGFAVYDQYIGWIGSLKFLQPQEGYVMRTNSTHVLTYPNPELFVSSARTSARSSISDIVIPWSVRPADFSNEMSLIIKTNICESVIDTTRDFLGVFVGDECRGVIKPTYISELDEYIFFLSAYANKNSESLSFKFYDASELSIYDIIENEEFVSEALLGTLSSPIELSVSENLSCIINDLDRNVSEFIHVYPNPFQESITIQLSEELGQIMDVTLSDITGKEMIKFGKVTDKILWTGLDSNGDKLPDGLYLLSVHTATNKYQIKVTKTK